MSSRDLLALDNKFQPLVYQFLDMCKAQKLEVLIYCTRRTFAEQDDLYAQGRTVPGHVVTNARAGQSAHNYGLAFDGAPTIGGKILWAEPLTGEHWLQYGRIGKMCGMEWGADWVGFREGPHLQMANWKQIAGLVQP